METNTMLLLTDSLTRHIFNFIATQRKVRFKDLRQSLHLEEEAVSTRLNELKKANLIEELGAPLEDFTTYYVTADGLSAERELRRR